MVIFQNSYRQRYSSGWLRVLLALMLTFGVFHVCHAGAGFAGDIAELRTLYLDAVDSGDKRTLRKVIKQVNALAQRHPDHALLLIYQGCAFAERGRDEHERPLNRKRDTEEGLRLIDRGLRQLQQGGLPLLESVEARLMATMLFIHLPDTIFHRFKEGEALVLELLAEPGLDEMPGPLQAGIYLAAAIVADKHGAMGLRERYLELVLKVDPDGRNGKRAREMRIVQAG